MGLQYLVPQRFCWNRSPHSRLSVPSPPQAAKGAWACGTWYPQAGSWGESSAQPPRAVGCRDGTGAVGQQQA
jgi:hypothetical protein